jgi:putative glucoamylase/uncharacterized protein DUF3131
MGRPTRLLLVLALGILVLAPGTASAAALSVAQQRTLRQYAVDTWKSFVAMTNPATGLPSDNINADTRARSAFTSPTNIGAYMWSAIAARDLQIITPLEAQRRISTTLTTLARLERHGPSGQFYNWYNPDTGAKLTSWPVDNSTVYPFLSSVDNGWLAMTLMMVQRAVPQLSSRAGAIVSSMDFGFYYEGPDDPSDFDSNGSVVKENGPGLIRGGFWKDPPAGQCNIPGNYRTDDRPDAGPPVYYTCHHYGSFNTEPRIASYVGIARKQIPARHYWNGWRTFPDTCDWGWHEMKPEGVSTTYTGADIAGNYSVTVYEGHYHYRGMNFVPTWGGSMFEALMVPLFVPEEQWGPQSWGINHPLYVRGQIEHGLQEAHYGYWGFSPSNNPAGGYREYGVDPLGLNPDGYSSDQERTTVDYGFGECRPPQPPPSSYGQGVVTPHASFLAIDFDSGRALTNLSNLRRDFDAYGWGGFYDAINAGDPETGAGRGQVSRFYLALDQGMVMAAIGNALRGDRLQKYFVQGAVQAAIQPLMAKEVFTAGE